MSAKPEAIPSRPVLVPPPSPRTKKRIRKGKWLLVLILLLLLAALVPPLVRLNRFRARLESSLSAAVGRAVHVQNVRLKLLPQPGFELSGFSIADDPAFSSEPLLRADDVTAALRLTSLWRGRIEIARLDLSSPSLNLVRAADGGWNLEGILTHASAVPAAPTGEAGASVKPRFPYIEASAGRINLKIGPEKKVFALADADFALWQASEQEWEMRLSARPVRTDADLNDTGTVRVSGRFARAALARATPLHLNISLTSSQLGQLSHLFYGRDRGWRGAVNAELRLSGSPELLHLAAHASIRDFRRYDIGVPDSVVLSTDCQAVYSHAAPEPALRGNCVLPAGRGLLNLSGEYLPASKSAELNLLAADFPADQLARLLKHMKRGVAPDLSAAGAVNGHLAFKFPRAAAPQSRATRKPGADSSILTAQVSLHSRLLGDGVNLGTLVLLYQQSPPSASRLALAAKRRSGAPAFFTLLPAHIALGEAAPLIVSGSASAAGYEFALRGSAEASRLEDLLSAFGLPSPFDSRTDSQASRVADSSTPRTISSVAANASTAQDAGVDLKFAGNWSGFAQPTVTGSVKFLPQRSLAREPSTRTLAGER